MHNEYLQTFLRSLLNNDASSCQTVEAFRCFLGLVWKASPELYRALFLRHEVRPREQIAALDLREGFEAFCRAGLFEPAQDGGCSSAVMIHRNVMDIERSDLNPSVEWFIVTDWPDIPAQDAAHGRDMVFPIHYESIYLLRVLHETHGSLEGKRCLDMFCGSGILAVFSALSGAREVVAADISDRALAFTRFNSVINGQKNVIRLSRTDIFEHQAGEDLTGNQFDVVLANAPFEPTPKEFSQKYFTHSYGGEHGHAILQPFLDQVDRYVAEHGMLITVCFTCGKRDEADHLVGWESGDEAASSRLRLGGLKGYRGDLDILDSISLDQFFLHFMPQTEEEKRHVAALRRKLSDEGYDRLYLFSMKLHKEPGSLEVKRAASAPPCDWTVPLNWYLPCGFPANITQPVKLLLIDPPLHSYFPRDSVMRDQGKQLELPLNLVYLGTYLRERFPHAVTIKLLHLDFELFNSIPGLAEEDAEISTGTRYATDAEVLAELAKWIENEAPDVVGVGGFTMQAELMEMILRQARRARPGILTIAGGPHLTFQYRDFLGMQEDDDRVLDFAVLAEGEYALEDILRGYLLHDGDREALVASIETGCYAMPRNTRTRTASAVTRCRTRAEDILPMELDLLPGATPTAFLEKANIILHTKRGCPRKCAFCISSRFFGPHAATSHEVVRPVEYVCAEIKKMRDHECFSVEIMDETFGPLLPPSPPLRNSQFELCAALAKAEFQRMDFVVQTRADLLTDANLAIMKAARISTILVGIESASDQVLARVKKGETIAQIEDGIRRAKDFGYRVGAFWILGLPGATEEDDQKSLRWIANNAALIDWHEVNLFVPYPGTAYFPDGLSNSLDLSHSAGMAGADIPFHLRLLDDGRPRYGEWQRFGHIRCAGGGQELLPVRPVYETDIYPADKLLAVLQRLQSGEALGYSIINPPVVPHGGDAGTRKALQTTLIDIIQQLALRFEQDIEEVEGQRPLGEDQRTSKDLETIARSVFADLDDTDNGKMSIAQIAIGCLEAFHRKVKHTRFESLVVIPFRLHNGDAIPIHGDVKGAIYHCREGSSMREALTSDNCLVNAWSESSLYVVHYYLTYASRPYLEFKPLQARRSELRLLNGDEIASRLRGPDSVLAGNPEEARCTAGWLVAVGINRDRYTSSDDTARRDIEFRVDAQGVFSFIDAFVRVFMSNLAGRLALKVQSEINEELTRVRQYHVLHDLKNLVSSGDWLFTLKQNLEGLLLKKLKHAEAEGTSAALSECANELRSYILTGQGFNYTHEGAAASDGILPLALSQRRLNNVIWANVAIYDRRPEEFSELDAHRTLAQFFADEFFARYASQWRDASNDELIRVRLFFNDETIPRIPSLATATPRAIESTLQDIFGDRTERLASVTIFDIILPELVRNVIKYADDRYPVDFRLELTSSAAGEHLLGFFATNHTDWARARGGRRGFGIGTRRIREALSANMALTDRELAAYYPLRDPVFDYDSSRYSTGFRFSFTRYARALETKKKPSAAS